MIMVIGYKRKEKIYGLDFRKEISGNFQLILYSVNIDMKEMNGGDFIKRHRRIIAVFFSILIIVIGVICYVYFHAEHIQHIIKERVRTSY